MKINWLNYVSNINILARANFLPIETIITRTQMRWIGHVSRMDNVRLLKCILYSEMVSGVKSKGGQKKRFQICINKVVNNMSLSNTIGKFW